MRPFDTSRGGLILIELDIKTLKVLVVDDQMLMCRLLEAFLHDEGVKQVDIATCAAEAEEKLAEQSAGQSYDMVLLDRNLPDKSGDDLLHALRRDRRYDGMAIVMVTASSEERAVIDALKAGATAYIAKPVSKDAFTKNLHKTVSWLERVRGREGM